MHEATLSIVGDRNVQEDGENEEIGNDIPKRRLVIELLIETTMRLRNVKIVIFFSAVLSVIALGASVLIQFWAILSKMSFLFSRRWTVELVREIGDEVALAKIHDASSNIGLCIADNKAYFDRIGFIHAQGIDGVCEEPLKANGKLL